MGIIAEYRGTLIDLVAGDKVLNFDMNDILSALFGGTRGQFVGSKPTADRTRAADSNQ